MNKSRIEQGLADYLGAELAGVDPGVVATADVGADSFAAVAHGFQNGEVVRWLSGGFLPSPLIPGRPYYIISASADSFQLSMLDDGEAIDLITTGTGVHSVHRVIVATRPGTTDLLLPTAGHVVILTLEEATLKAGHLGDGMLRIQVQTAGALREGSLAGFQEVMDKVELAFPRQHKMTYAAATAKMSDAVNLVTNGDMTINGNFAYGWEDAEDNARFIQDYMVKVGLAEAP